VEFFYLLLSVLRDPSTGRRETLPHDRKLAKFYNARLKIWGLTKNIGGQNMQLQLQLQFRSILYNLRL